MLPVRARPPAASRPGTGGRVIQRAASISINRPDTSHGDRQEIADFAQEVKRKVNEAFIYVVRNPLLGNLAQFDGHTRLWVRKWQGYLQNGIDQLLAADFGYAIESVACANLAAPSGFRFELQAVRNGTRPDIVLWKGQTEVAWYDITASNSTGHILNKVGWDTRLNVFEVVYPSVDFSTLDQLAATLAQASVVDGDMIAYARAYQAWVRDKMLRWTKEYLSNALDTGTLLRRGGDPLIRENTNRQRVNQRLGTFFGRSLTEGETTSVLKLVGPNTYGFNGLSSTSLGEHLLLGRMGVPSYPTQMPYVDRPFGSISVPFSFQGFNPSALSQPGPVSRRSPPSIFERLRKKKDGGWKPGKPKLQSATHSLSQRIRRGDRLTLNIIHGLLVDSGYDINQIRRVELVGRRGTFGSRRLRVTVVREGRRAVVRVAPVEDEAPRGLTSGQLQLPPLQSLPPTIPQNLPMDERIEVEAIRITSEDEVFTLAKTGSGNQLFGL